MALLRDQRQRHGRGSGLREGHQARALDELGRKNYLSRFFFKSEASKTLVENSLNDKTIYELVKTASQLAKDKTGALIVIEYFTPLGEYINTGISIDAVVSSQLLINIFEKN